MVSFRIVAFVLFVISLMGCASRENTYWAITDSDSYWHRSGFSIKPPSGSTWSKLPTNETRPNSIMFARGEGWGNISAATNRWIYLKGTRVIAVSALLDEPVQNRADKSQLTSALRNHLERYQMFSPTQIKDASYDVLLGLDCLKYTGKAKKERFTVEEIDLREDEVKGYFCLHPHNDTFGVVMESHNFASVNIDIANKNDQVDHFFTSLSFAPMSSSVSRTFRTNSYHVGNSPSHLVLVKNKLWVSVKDEDRIVQISPGDGQVVSSVPVGKKPAALTTLDQSIWVANSGDGTVTRIDPADARVIQTIPVGGKPVAISGRDASVWVADVAGNRIIRIDPATNRVVATIAVGQEPTWVVAGTDGVWTTNAGDGTLSLIGKTGNNVVDTIKVGGRPIHVSLANTGAWVADEAGKLVIRINRKTRGIQSKIPVGGTPGWVRAIDGWDVFVALSDAAQIERINPVTNQVFGPRIRGEAAPRAIILTSGSLWFINSTGTSLTKVDLNPYGQEPYQGSEPYHGSGLERGQSRAK